MNEEMSFEQEVMKAEENYELERELVQIRFLEEKEKKNGN